MSLSPHYEKQLKTMHVDASEDRLWGTTGHRNFGPVLLEYLKQHDRITSVLDFGCGQGTLGLYVKNILDRTISWKEYDPGILGKDKPPQAKYDLVVSSDVLEHVEPEHVEATIKELQDYATKAMFHFISCGEGEIQLPDGRPEHLSVHDPHWWKDKFDHPDWELMYWADERKRKRGGMKKSVLIQTDRIR